MIKVREDFKALIPPLSAEEYSQLEQNCLEEGIRDPLVLWGDTLIDGHNRYEIAQKHNLAFKTVNHKFENEAAAKAWIIRNQFGRRNLSAYDRSVLALKLKPVISEKAKERQATHTEQGYQKSDKAEHTAKELAKVAGVSHDTIHKVEAINEKASEETKRLVREGILSINQAYNSVQPKKEDAIKKAIQEHEQFKEQKRKKVIGLKDIQVDKINRELIDNKVLQETIKAFNIIICLANDHHESLARLGEIIGDQTEKRVFLSSCEACISTLELIRRSLGGNI